MQNTKLSKNKYEIKQKETAHSPAYKLLSESRYLYAQHTQFQKYSNPGHERKVRHQHVMILGTSNFMRQSYCYITKVPFIIFSS